MFKKLLGLLLLAVVMVSGAFGREGRFQTPEEYAAFADACYSDNDLDLDARKECMDTMVRAADAWPDNYGIQWRAAQAAYVYGDMLDNRYMAVNLEAAGKTGGISGPADVMRRSQELTGTQADTLMKIGSAARRYAEKAVTLNPGAPEGHFYGAMGIALYSYGKSIVKALLEGLGPKYEGHLNVVLKADPSYQKGIAFSAYGRYYYSLPWPKRNMKKSLEMLKTAETRNPDNVVILDFLGDTSFALGKKDDAVWYWDRALNSNNLTYAHRYIKQLIAAKLKSVWS